MSGLVLNKNKKALHDEVDVIFATFCHHQSMERIELKRSSPIQIHEPLILIQTNPADHPESESSPVHSGHNRVSIYQMPSKIDM